MDVQTAEKRDLTGVKSEDGGQRTDDGGRIRTTDTYDERLHARFTLWMQQSGASLAKAARMINRSTALVHGYINKAYQGDIEQIEKDIESLLRREQDLELTLGPEVFCTTQASVLIWEVLQYCDERCRMGVVIAESGTGKSTTALHYQKQNRATMIVTANATTRTLGATMRLLIEHVGGRPKTNTIDDMLNKVVKRLKGSRRLLIIDDAHFIPWAGLEIIRKLYDCAGIGVVYLGQEDLYDQMTSNVRNTRLFDQIYSRIAIKRDRVLIEKNDVKMVIKSLWPREFGRDEMTFLHQKARQKGHLRNITFLLELFAEIRQGNPGLTDMEALAEAEKFLMQEGSRK